MAGNGRQFEAYILIIIFSRFAVGTTNGFQVYCCNTTSTKPSEIFKPQYEMRHSGGTSVIGLLFERPLIIHVDTPGGKV